jgi:hypothetical protein
MAEIVATPISVLAQSLGCKPIEAAEFWRKVASDLAGYVHQKLPTAVQVSGANAGMLVIMPRGMEGGTAGLDLRLAAHDGQGRVQVLDLNALPSAEDLANEENQGLSSNDDASSHGEPSHDKGK